ncbi:MAG: site-specific integrase [candidate division Zixibacteria bacterium]|nr:site-specific integrase [candidate division Zixibacteria bacterium]
MACLRRRRERGGRFQLDYSEPDGRRRRIDTGTTDEVVARLWLAEAERRESLARLGIIETVGLLTVRDVLGETVPGKTDSTLSAYRATYLDRCKHDMEMADSTLSLIGNAFDSFSRTVGDMKLRQITDEHVRAWKRGARVSKTSLSIYQRALRAAFARAVKWKFLDSNPFAGVEVPKQESHRQAMTPLEVRILLESVKDENYRLFLQFLLYTGCRRGEILNVKGIDIDTDRWVLSVLAVKTGRRLMLPIAKELARILEGVPLPEGFLFASEVKPGQTLNKSWVTHRFKKELERAGLPGHYSLHSLRHTFATHLRAKGIPRDIVSALMGHQSAETTAVYDHTAALHFRQFVDQLTFGE